MQDMQYVPEKQRRKSEKYHEFKNSKENTKK